MSTLFGNLWSGKRDMALVLAMVGILVILFTPMPPLNYYFV
jgi:flagellar biosynthesis protein FlhA